MNPNDLAIQVALAYCLDLIFGDPYWLPHPVRQIGRFGHKLEPFLRKTIKHAKLAGVIFAITIIVSTWFATFLIVKLLSIVNPLAGWAASILLIYTALATRSLDVESRKVYLALKKNDLNTARQKLGFIVSRDTENLNREEIIRATVETIAENIVDGIIAPLCFVFLGGAPLALAYKAINTLDSIVGQRNKRYQEFGWAAARIDDMANFIPARISALLLPMASWLTGKNGLKAWKICLRDRKNSPSPNSGIPEAAVAGALGIQLGGQNTYQGKTIFNPLIGDNHEPPDLKHILESIRIIYAASGLTVILGIGIMLF